MKPTETLAESAQASADWVGTESFDRAITAVLSTVGKELASLVSDTDDPGMLAPVDLEVNGRLRKGALLALRDRAILVWYVGLIRPKISAAVIPYATVEACRYSEVAPRGEEPSWELITIGSMEEWNLAISDGATHGGKPLAGLIAGIIEGWVTLGVKDEESSTRSPGTRSISGEHPNDQSRSSTELERAGSSDSRPPSSPPGTPDDSVKVARERPGTWLFVVAIVVLVMIISSALVLSGRASNDEQVSPSTAAETTPARTETCSDLIDAEALSTACSGASGVTVYRDDDGSLVWSLWVSSDNTWLAIGPQEGNPREIASLTDAGIAETDAMRIADEIRRDLAAPAPSSTTRDPATPSAPCPEQLEEFAGSGPLSIVRRYRTDPIIGSSTSEGFDIWICADEYGGLWYYGRAIRDGASVPLEATPQGDGYVIDYPEENATFIITDVELVITADGRTSRAPVAWVK